MERGGKDNKMFIKRKKLISILIATIITLSIFGTLSATATNINDLKSNEIFLLSKEIPESATEYARDYFTTYTSNELLNLGFTQKEIINLRLSPGVTAYEYDSCDAQFYYFPVVDDDRVIAMLTMIDFGDERYSVQFGKSNFANSLNDIKTKQNEPAILVITNDFMYALDVNDNFTMLEEFLIMSDLGLSTASNQARNIITPNITFSEARFVCDVNILISDDTKYDETIDNSPLRTTEEAYLNVDFVANGTNASFPNGYCWASSLGSIIKYRINTTYTATQWRDILLNNAASKNWTGTVENAKDIMETYINGASVTLTNSTLTFATTKAIINNDKPIYSSWRNTTDTSGHAMVIRGYLYTGTPASVTRISLMDPNKSSYQAVDPTGSYVVGSLVLYWKRTVY